MPMTEKFPEQRVKILKHLQNELVSLLDSNNLPTDEQKEVESQMREVAQVVMIALGIEVTGEEGGVIQANLNLSKVDNP